MSADPPENNLKLPRITPSIHDETFYNKENLLSMDQEDVVDQLLSIRKVIVLLSVEHGKHLVTSMERVESLTKNILDSINQSSAVEAIRRSNERMVKNFEKIEGSIKALHSDCRIISTEVENTKKNSLSFAEVVRSSIVPKIREIHKASDPREKGLVVKMMEERDNETKEMLRNSLIEKIPGLTGRLFNASRMGPKGPNHRRAVLLLPSGESSLREDIKEIRDSVADRKVRIEMWKSYEDKKLESTLFKKGMDMKNAGECNNFQIRGNRLRVLLRNEAVGFFKAYQEGNNFLTKIDEDPKKEEHFPKIRAVRA